MGLELVDEGEEAGGEGRGVSTGGGEGDLGEDAI